MHNDSNLKEDSVMQTDRTIDIGAKMSFNHGKTNPRLALALENHRFQWSQLDKLVFKTRDAINFKRRHQSPDRATTLMNLQAWYKPREKDTLQSFYQTTMPEENSR